MNRALDFWRARPERERKALAIGAALTAAVLLLAFVLVPIERSRERLARELPRLRDSIAGLQRDADEVKRLRALPAAAGGASSPLASLASNAGGLPGAAINVIDDKRVRVTGNDVAFGALLEWLAAAQATHGMRVESARLEALPSPGRVRAEIFLARS
jgi:general secretion pathway protein M